MRFKKRWKISVRCLLSMLFILLLNLAPLEIQAAVPVQTVIPVSCIGENTSESFKVLIRMESEEFQQCNKKEICLKNDEKDSFTVTYTYPGTYRYEIWQERGTDAKTTYDDTVYTVDVYVTEDEEGEMHAEPVIFIRGKNEKCAEASFKNSKVVPKGTGSKTGLVKTGDTTEVGKFLLFMGTSSGMLVLLIFASKRRKGGEK